MHSSQEEARQAAAEGAELVWEVWDVVDREYLDVRATGFSRPAWAAVRDAALAGAPGPHAAPPAPSSVGNRRPLITQLCIPDFRGAVAG